MRTIEELAKQWLQDQGLALFDILRAKWNEVPGGLSDRVSTEDVLALSDRELRDFWQGVLAETTTGPGFAVRGWYHAVYSDIFRGRRVLDYLQRALECHRAELPAPSIFA